MTETKLTSEELKIISENNGLKMYLNGLLDGHSFTPRSNLYNLEGKTAILQPDEILARWLKQLNVLKKGSSPEQGVFHFDISQLEKWGPQGGVAPIHDLLDEIVAPSFKTTKTPEAFSSSEWEQAKKNVREDLLLYVHSLRPAAFRRVVDDMRARDTLESNSGWPLFTRRNKPEVIAQAIQAAENGQWKTYPAIALFRNYNKKTRLVWMFPMASNLVEGSFFQPLQSAIMKSPLASNFFAPWKGFEQVRDVITQTYPGSVIAASDFSSTDSHFKLAASMEVYDVIKYCFQVQYREQLKESLVAMHSIPLIVSPTTKVTGEHGVSSGSNWTNFIETIFDMIFSEYVFLKDLKHSRGARDTYSGLYAIGDDMAWVNAQSGYDTDFASRLEDYGKSVGQSVREDKTMNDPDKVKSLQRLFQRGYLRPDGKIRGVYSTIRALKSLVYPERFHKPEVWSKDMEAIRDFMILENCVDHPLFEEFCKFVAAGDPHLVEFAKMSRQQQDSLFAKSKLVRGLNSTYNQEKRDQSLSQFNSVKFIAKL